MLCRNVLGSVDQTGSAWFYSGQNGPEFHGDRWLPSQIHAINPIMISLYSIFNGFPVGGGMLRYLWALNRCSPDPLAENRDWPLSNGPAFLLPAHQVVDQSRWPKYRWQLLSYVIITAAESLSITCLSSVTGRR